MKKRILLPLLAGIIGIVGTANSATVEYQLSGRYEMLAAGTGTPNTQQLLRAFVAERTPPGQTPRLSAELISEFRKLHGATAESAQPMAEGFSREFTVWVRGNAWCIHTRRVGMGTNAGWEHGTVDGKEYYMSLNTGGASQGWVFHRPWGVPHSLAEIGVPMLWLMTASAGYFQTLTNRLIWPPHVKWDLSGDKEQTQDHRQPGVWELRSSTPQLPNGVAFLDGRGQTNATYQITGLTNLGRILLPSGFIWERLGAPKYETGQWVPNVQERMVVHCTNFSPVCTRADLRPRTYPGMSVVDYRVKQPAEYANTNRMKGYVLAPGQSWVPKAAAQAKVNGRPYLPWWYWVIASIAAVMLLGGAVVWLRWRARPCVPPRRPPPPTDSPSP